MKSKWTDYDCLNKKRKHIKGGKVEKEEKEEKESSKPYINIYNNESNQRKNIIKETSKLISKDDKVLSYSIFDINSQDKLDKLITELNVISSNNITTSNKITNFLNSNVLNQSSKVYLLNNNPQECLYTTLVSKEATSTINNKLNYIPNDIIQLVKKEKNAIVDDDSESDDIFNIKISNKQNKSKIKSNEPLFATNANITELRNIPLCELLNLKK